MTRGYFITLEGGEAVGKTTQANLLEDALRSHGHEVVRTREPGGTPGAEVLRNLLLNGTVAWSSRAEILLHFAARSEHLEKTIVPALEAGCVVISDRFYDSTTAYQGYGLGGDRCFIATQVSCLIARPDCTIVLDSPESIAFERLRARASVADRYERLDHAFHARVRKGFRSIAEHEPERCVLLDATSDIETVRCEILAAIRQRLPGIL
jgi:dTMP kinase